MPSARWRDWEQPPCQQCGAMTDERAYSDDAMRAYAEQAVAAERERCIDIVAMFGGSVEIEAAIRRAE